ncbi:MAG: hypothetical protein HXX10_24855, partial [Rhodoplanes sp.]|nr:hypothetical protein [Rhodoplanes sp.]
GDGELGDNGDGARRRRRRGRRGGRRNRRQDGTPGAPYGNPDNRFDLLEPEVADAIADFGGPRLGEDIGTGEQPDLVDMPGDYDRPARVTAEAPRETQQPDTTAELGPENLPTPGVGFDAPERPVEPRRARSSRRHVEAAPPPPDFGPVEPPEPLQALAPETLEPAAEPVRASARVAAPEEPAPAPAEPPRRRSTVREPVSFVLEPRNVANVGEPPAPPVAEAQPVAAEPAPSAEPAPVPPPPAESEPAKPRRTGWWARKLLGDKD